MSTDKTQLSIGEMEEQKRRLQQEMHSPPPQPIRAPSGSPVPHMDSAPQEFFSRHGQSDAETLQLKRAIRTLARHWLLITLVTVLFPLLMHIYDVHLYRILSRPQVPAWARIGARKLYSANATFKFNRISLVRSSRIIPVMRLSAEDLRMLPGLAAFKKIFHQHLLNAVKDDPQRTALVKSYIERKGDGATTRISVKLASETTGTVRATGPNPKLLLILVNNFTPATNEYVRTAQLGIINKELEESRQLIKSNDMEREKTWQQLDELNRQINKELNRNSNPDLNSDELRRERHELRKAAVKLQIHLSQLRESNDYEALAAKFFLKTPKDIDQIFVAGNPLREEWARLQQELVRLQMNYTDEHPRIIKLKGDIEAIKKQLAKTGNITSMGRVPPIPKQRETEILRAIAEVNTKLKLNRSELKYINDKIKEADISDKRKSAKLNDRMQKIERERSNLRAKINYQQTKSIKLINNSAGLELERVRIQRRKALESLAPSKSTTLESPKYWVDISMAVILGLILGCGLAFLHASMDNYIHTPADVYYHLRLNYLGVIPYWKSRQPKLLDPERPISGIAEVYAHLCNNIRFGRAENPEKRLLIASAVPREGKSTISVNLAIRYALEGNSVLLIDTDMRRPRGKKILEGYCDPEATNRGLADFLSGEVAAEQAIQTTKVPDLYFMAAGTHPKNPTNLLRKPILPQFLDEMEKRYDVIILDCPALLPVVDATILAPYARGVLLVIAAGEVEISSVRMTMHRLQHVGAPIIGAALNKIKEKSASYGYYGYYGSRRYHYYHNYYGAPEPEGA